MFNAETAQSCSFLRTAAAPASCHIPMNTALRSLTLAALALGAAAGVHAQSANDDSATPRPGRHLHRFGHPIVRVIDTNRDRVLSATELANAPAALKTLDANNDGVVSADELRPARPADAPPPPEGAKVFRRQRAADDVILLALDANSDGALSAEEIANAPASLNALDASGDGQLTLDEFGSPPPQGAPARRN